MGRFDCTCRLHIASTEYLSLKEEEWGGVKTSFDLQVKSHWLLIPTHFKCKAFRHLPKVVVFTSKLFISGYKIKRRKYAIATQNQEKKFQFSKKLDVK